MESNKTRPDEAAGGENTILLVEDSIADADLVLDAFQRWKVTNPVQVVQDGEAATDYLAGNGRYSDRAHHPLPCLMLLDLHLPKIPGLEVLKWVRSQPGLVNLPVVVLTGSKDANDFDQAHRLGANACVAKTLDLAGLHELIQHLNYFSLASPYHRSNLQWDPGA